MRIFGMVICSLLISSLHGQAATPLSQSEMLTSFELEYLSPVEVETASLGAGKLGRYSYQMGVEIDNGNSLALVTFEPDFEAISPRICLAAKVATLATNDQDVEIKMMLPSQEDNENLNADWISHAVFTPKLGAERYDHGKLTALYREGVGLIYIYYLSRGEKFLLGELFQFMDLE